MQAEVTQRLWDDQHVVLFLCFNCTNTKGNRLHFFYYPRVILSWLPKRAELAVRYNNLVRALDFIKQFCCCLGIFLFSILLKLYQKNICYK